MNTVTVKKDGLLAIVKENREAHRAQFEKAVDGYREDALIALEQHIKRIKGGSLKRISILMPTPVDMTSEYDKAIKMLEMHIEDTIQLDDATARCLVLNDWDWTERVTTTNSGYIK